MANSPESRSPPPGRGAPARTGRVLVASSSRTAGEEATDRASPQGPDPQTRAIGKVVESATDRGVRDVGMLQECRDDVDKQG